MEESPKKTIFKRWWFWSVILFIVAGASFAIFTLNKKGVITELTMPKCPENLEGVLTYPLIDLSKISAITPLGNLNPPGHTSPVDHNYFSTNSTEKIALYAPADSTITNIIALYQDLGSGYKPTDFVVQYTVCKGIILDFAGYTEIIKPLRDQLAKQKGSCKGGIVKEGHEGKEQQCGYFLNYKVKSGDLIGYTQAKVEEKSGELKFPFEIWAANYNKEAPSNIDWSFYEEERYAHIMCTFDLYADEIRNQFYDKLGGERFEIIKDPSTGKLIKNETTFIKRTIEPVCGTVNHNIVGTIQGMWFGKGWKTQHVRDFVDDRRQFSIFHYNVDPTYAQIGNAGEISNGQAGQIQFIANHTGTIDREPSEVRADGKVYCYNYQNQGKILVQLMDNTNLKLEHQSGTCTESESFNHPYYYER